ncbi:CPBP family intramembrane glutamic endopeptidase [Dysgonomonas sp. 511]|uniref:CPBP family intramembrane glutamic endopeptidase n=1 Tax=Dysgonomonas sp. 511 TaxID=2302930 RepID=UPI0013D03FAE|nr:type II CAAX endopeptidase family protein [Dysgonomonas sp. 511]NDV79998.1 CPBP family intramembrane metalloprotease [Dysgonomonas sp. 511]
MQQKSRLLRPIWRFLSYNWIFGVFLILLFGIPRFILVLQANSSGGGYGMVSLVFVAMWFTPFILLSKTGRQYIGIRKPTNYKWLLYSFIAGALFCTITFALTWLIYGDTIDNSFVYIAKSYTVPHEELEANRFAFFLTFAISGMIFSPIGEELFFRGIVHGCFAEKLGERKASVVDSLAFALTHLAHFGIVFYAGKWELLILPATLWVVSMFVLSQIFFYCKQKSGSVLGAITSHAGYNFAMIYLIFYYIF